MKFRELFESAIKDLEKGKKITFKSNGKKLTAKLVDGEVLVNDGQDMYPSIKAFQEQYPEV